jgi:predicted KAP-like P-loop ATPase
MRLFSGLRSKFSHARSKKVTNHSDAPDTALEDAFRLSGDRPKERIADDRLGYASFARAFARSIAELAPTDGIVLAINGPWGSGKTSAANMVVEALSELEKSKDENYRVIPVRFNPWWFSQQEDLVKAFFAELSSSLEKDVSERVLQGLRQVAHRLSASKDLVIAGLDFIPGGGIAKAAVGASFKKVGDLAGQQRSLFQLREELRVALRKEGKRILVIIDDVDRLPADELRQIFRLVKSVADLPNVIHLLIFDRDIAKQALAENERGSEWHEKIVQASFDLPPVHPVDIHRLFLEGLERLVGPINLPNRTRWGNVFYAAIAPWLRTPRDAARLLNVLMVSWPAVAGDVDLADYVVLETIRLYEPRLHAFIRQSPEQLTGLVQSTQRAGQTLGEKLLALVDASKQDHVKAAIQHLFPKLEQVWSNHSYTPEFANIMNRERRVCIASRFPAYFGFGIGDEALSSEELNDFIINITDSVYVRSKLAACAAVVRRTGGTKAAVVLEELISNVELVPAGSIPGGIFSLFDAADLLANPLDERSGGFFFVPPIWRFWFLMKGLLERLIESARADAIRNAFDRAGSLRGLCFAMTVFRTSLGRDPEAKPEAAGAPLVNASVFQDLEEKLQTRLQAASQDGSLLASPGLLENLVEWSRLAGESIVNVWTDGILGDDTSVLRLAAAATQFARAHTVGDHVISEIPQVHRPSLEKVVNVERMVQRLNAISEAEPTPESLVVIKNFLEGLRIQFSFSNGENDEGA